MNATAAQTPAYVGLGRRSLAFFLDSIVWIVALSFVASGIPQDASVTAVGIVVLILLNLWFNYFWIAEWRFGRTIGKSAMGIRVTGESGGSPSWNDAALRNLLRIVDVLVIGEVMIAASRKRQRLGDRAGHTVVVRDHEREAAAEATRAAARSSSTGWPAQVAGGSGPDVTPPDVAPPPPPPNMPPPPPPPHMPPPPPMPPPASPPSSSSKRPEVAPPASNGVGIPAGRWTPTQVVYGLLIAVGLLIVESLIVSAFDPDLKSAAADLTLQALLAVTLIGVAVAFAAPRGAVREALGKLGLRRFKPSAIWLVLATYGAYVAISLVLTPLLNPQQEDITRDLGFDQSGLAAVIAGLLIVVAAPFSEEMFFRGFIFAGIRRSLPLWPAAAISGVVFGLVHLSAGDIGVGVQLAVFGMLLAWLYEYTGSLWPSIMTHAINNILAFIIVVSS